ncbi:GGDEF domain-containing protein [Qipengyuania soli]|uniref:diguanylate cyclase n=1 Tax=Qipengyuania soli TaxID=2782568 RepID=A0A7S8F4D7_9SPHN|nr:sensor domain-containing diguanylate cyclase [Qipengyuania soli]QPC98937.1 diguanylate cyclase [Qipengyuania soli]
MIRSRDESAPDHRRHENVVAAAEAALAGEVDPSRWPAELAAAYEGSLEQRQFTQGRLLLWTGLAVAIASILIDFLVIPEHAPLMLALRLVFVFPLQIAALLMPARFLGMQKMLMGCSIVSFAAILLIGVQWAPPLSAAYMAIGPVVLIGVAAQVLPYSPKEIGALVLAFGIVTGFAIVMVDAPAVRDPVFLGILIATLTVSLLLPHRIWAAEARNFLIARQSEKRLADLEETNRALEDLSRKDPLTGLANRRHATEVFNRHYDAAPATGEARVAVMMVDIDHFKAFNDRWGHQLGDECLQSVAEELRHSAARNGGLAARFGGEEFVLILRADSAAHAFKLADDLRTAVERIEIPHEETNGTATLTTSIGVAMHNGTGKPELSPLLGAADAALYAAKAGGRNRCEMAA